MRGGLRVYIAGALSSKENEDRNPSKVVTDYISNLSKMCIIASQVRRLGHYPYVPGTDFLLGLVAGDWEEDKYRGIGMAFLEVCDVMLVTSMSWGVKEEMKRAKALGIPIYDSIKYLPTLQ